MDQRLHLQDLHRRLGQLEHKVQAYRHELATEFQSFCRQTVAQLPPDEALSTEQSFVSSLGAYPLLGPLLESSLATRAQESQLEQSQQDGRNNHLPDSQRALTSQPSTTPASPSSALAGTSKSVAPAHPDQSSPLPPAAVFGAAVDVDPVVPASNQGQGSPSHPRPPSPASPGSPGSPSGGSPHDREKEFQGLFTPFFLPLLDSSPSLQSSPPPPTANRLPPSTSLLSAAPVTAAGTAAGNAIGSGLSVHVAAGDQLQGSPRHLQGQDMEGSGETGAGHGALSGITSTSESSSQAQAQVQSQAASSPPSRPAHLRRATDDTISSGASDKSETKIRRSALRRSSSGSNKISNPSPRRVRFEFRGVEVLPTASPQPSDFPTPRPSSPIDADQPRTFDEIADDNGNNAVEEPTDSAPPRKISSTEALRALSRAPLDEGSVWTVVNPGSDPERKDSSSSVSTMNSRPTTPTAAPAPAASGTGPTSQSQLPLRPYEQEEEDEDSSDEEFLSIGKAKSFQKKATIQSTTSAPSTSSDTPTEATPSIAAPKKEEDDRDQTSSEDFDEDEDDMFHFESGGLSAPPRPKRRPPPLKDDRAESPEVPEHESDNEQLLPPMSPGVPISRRPDSSGPSTPTAAKFQVGSLGSYKGRPVIMPVVKNPEVHAQAASLGEFNTFVGGLDGRSGVDEGDLNSFRASLVQSGFSGTPRSLTERMLMEDAQAERRRQEQESN